MYTNSTKQEHKQDKVVTKHNSSNKPAIQKYMYMNTVL